MSEANTESFEEVKRRLDEIVDAVTDDDLPLDDALKLYDEERSEDVQDAGEETPNASEPDASVEPALESN